MSDSPQIPPAAPEPAGAAKSEKPAKPKKEKKPGRWRRRFTVALIAIVAVALISRMLLSLLLPWTIRKVAHTYGLDCTYERSDIYLTGGDAGLWHVRVSQLDDGKIVAESDYCRADISLLQLLRGRLVVQRLEADGFELTLQRNADGTIPLLKRFLSGPQKPSAPKKAGEKPAPIDLSPPVGIDSILLTHVQAHIIDQAVQPALDTRVEMNLRFSDLASPVRPAKLKVELLPAPLLDSLTFDAEGSSDATRLDASFRFEARGLHPSPLAGYLAPFGIKAAAAGLSVRANGKINTTVIPGGADALKGTIQLQDIALAADGQDAMTLHGLSIDLAAVNPLSADVSRVTIEDGTFQARRTAAGNLRVAGLEFSPGGAPPDRHPAPAASGAAVAPPAGPAPAAPFRFTVGELLLKNFRASFIDQDVTPASELQFVVQNVSVKGIVADPAKPDAPVTIAGQFSAPGIAGPITIDGTCKPFAVKKTAELNTRVENVRPDALRPYLDMVGIQSDLHAGVLTCRLTGDVTFPVDGSMVANARLGDVKWGDGKELLALDDVKVSGLALAPGSVRVDAIEVAGPRLDVRREPSGALWAAGFRLLPPSSVVKSSASASAALQPASPHPAPATQPSPPADALANLPKLDIGRFTWNGVRLQLDDQSIDTPTSITVQDAGVELTGIHVDFDPKAPPSAPGKIRAWLTAPGLAGAIELKGTVTQSPGGLSADVEVNGEKLSASLAAPYLKALSIEPTLHDGAFHARAHVDVVQNDNGIHANVSAEDVHFSDAGEEMLGIDKASISDVELKPGLFQVGAVALDKPRGKAVRDEDGAIRVAGIRLLKKPPEVKKSAFAAAPPSVAAAAPAANSPVAPSMAPSTLPAAPTPDVLVLKKLSIHDAAFGWTDRAVPSAAQVNAHVSGDVDGVTWGRAADPATISFTLKADGIADEVKIAGTASATESSAATSLEISGAGLRQGALVSYLPPGTTIDLKDGRFHLKLDAGVALNSKGEVSGKVLLSAIDYRDGEKGPAMFHLDSAKVAVSRLDLPGGIIAIDEVSVYGAETAAHQSADGTLHAMGFAVGKPPTTQPTATTRPVATTQPAPTAVAQALVPKSPPPATQPSIPKISAGPLVIAKPKYPLITLGKLDLNLHRFTFTDEARPTAAPVVVSDLRFFARKPIAVLGDDPSSRPAIDLGLSLRVDHVIEAVKFDTQLTPFASQPTLQFDFKMTGLHGDGLLAIAPELKPTIDGSPLVAGDFRAHGEAQIRLDRLDPLDFSLERGFDADFLVKTLEYRAEPTGPVLIGVDEVRSEGVRVVPKTASVLIKTLEVNKIVGEAVRDKDGIHVLGLVIKLPVEQPPATQPSVAQVRPTTQKSAVAQKPSGPTTQKSVAALPTTQPAPVAVAAPPSAPAPDDHSEIRVNKMVVSGIDLRVEDRTVSPSFILPLNQLDFDARDLTSRALVEEHPMRFSLLVGAGKVELPHREAHGVGGALKDAASLLGGKKVDTTVVMEKRDLFSQVQADGVLTLFPQPKGWIKASVSAFDLGSLKSEVKQFNVNLANGVFDTAIDIRMPGDGTMAVHSNHVFTDLELSEPANGPIVRYLKLSAPLDVVIGALQDQDGSINIPLAVNVKKGNISGGEIAGAAVNAFGAIVVNAVAAAPVKVASAATDIAGGFIPGLGGDKTPKKEEPVVLTFAPGDDSISPADQQQLGILIQHMRETPNIEVTLRHELGGGDVSRAALRANPSPQDCQALVERLTRRKAQLQRARAEWSARARDDLASRSPTEAAATLESLHAVERDLASTENALDRLYDLLRPGADRQADRRTRQAALELAQARLQILRSAFAAAWAGSIDDRVHITRPQFNPTDGATGGKVEITLTVKKKS